MSGSEKIYKAHTKFGLLLLYYDIGTLINEYKTWGNKFIDNLSYDIQIAIPEIGVFRPKPEVYGKVFPPVF